MTFEEAIQDAEQFTKRHLLLENGFSIGCRADIFHYASLFAEADFSDNENLPKVFELLGTKDFEVAIRSLERGAKLSTIYSPEDPLAAENMLSDAHKLKEILVTTIASNHPARPGDINDEEYWKCHEFLGHFLGHPSGGHVFTLNYDLLLYWTVMHEADASRDPELKLRKNDSFGEDEFNRDADYVVWQGETAAQTANIHYMHGALHLFDAGSEIQKYTWIRSGNPLIDQAREALDSGKFPLFVAEGSSLKKKDRIRHNAYLYQALKVLTANARQRRHCFFIYGHSLAENDDHILRRLARGTFPKLYISLFGDPRSPSNLQIQRRAQSLSDIRGTRFPLAVEFFDAESASVWS